MEQNSLDHVREDLATMQAAMRKPLPFGFADARFCIAASVAAGIFSVSHALGAHKGWPLLLSGLPAILVCGAHLVYVAVKSRWNSDVNSTRREEYRTTLLILAPVALVTLAARHWAARAGMSHLQFGGVVGVVMGCSFVLIAVTNRWPSRYPRSCALVVGLPLIAGSLLYAFCTRTQGTTVVTCMAAVIFGLLAIVMHHHLRWQTERMSDAAD